MADQVLPAVKTPMGGCVREHLREDPIVWLITIDAHETAQPNPIWFVRGEPTLFSFRT